MPIDVACDCGKGFQVKDEHAGRRAKCPNCGTVVRIPASHSSDSDDRSRILGDPARTPEANSETRLLEEIKALLEAFLSQASTSVQSTPAAMPSVESPEWLDDLEPSSGQATPPALSRGRKQYKVLTQKDKWFSGKFDPQRLEEAVNSYASQGWSVKGIATASVPGFGGNRDELIVLMER